MIDPETTTLGHTSHTPSGARCVTLRPTMFRALHRAAYRVAHPVLTFLAILTPRRGLGAKCLLTYQGDVLLVRHTYGDSRRWDLPGGRVGRGEEPGAAARREAHEELGVELATMDALGARELQLVGRRVLIHYFCAELDSPDLRPDGIELAEARWYSPQAMPKQLGRGVRDVVRQALASVGT